MPTITLADVNTLAQQVDHRREPRDHRAGAGKPGLARHRRRAELLAVFDGAEPSAGHRVHREPVERRAGRQRCPAPGKVVSEKSIPAINVTEWKLSNGVRVLVKPTDFKADEVLFSALQSGRLVAGAGRRLHVGDVLGMQAIIRTAASGTFSIVDLNKKLTGKVAAVRRR